MAIDTDLVAGARVAYGHLAQDLNKVQKATTGAASMNDGIGYFGYTALAAGSTVTGPANPYPGQIITIKDETGNANTYNITFDPYGSATIDGSATKAVVAAAYGAVRVMFNGTNWFTV
jgi:hypothetical protein